jgi:hypothetical protein
MQLDAVEKSVQRFNDYWFFELSRGGELNSWFAGM